jgi:hypothetical protein
MLHIKVLGRAVNFNFSCVEVARAWATLKDQEVAITFYIILNISLIFFYVDTILSFVQLIHHPGVLLCFLRQNLAV